MSGREAHAMPLKGQSLYEQHHRFAFACEQVAGLKVLDLVCGQGDGSAMLAAAAAEVIAIDANDEAIARAQTLYGNLGSLVFQVADVHRLPFANAQFDAVVSFEALLPGDAPEAIINEIRRVLKPEGFALFSLAELRISDPAATAETSTGEWAKFLDPSFSNVAVYGQRMVSASSLSPLSSTHAAPNTAEYRGYRTTAYGGVRSKTGPGVVRFKDPTNFICVASNAPIPHIAGPDSIYLMESIDLWAEQSELYRHAPDSHAIAGLTEELQHARTRILALVEARDSLERAFANHPGGQPKGNSTDLSVIGPMMEELAGQPIPADIPNLVRLLGQVAVRSAQQDVRLSELGRLQRHAESLQAELDRQTEIARDAIAHHEAAALASRRNADAVAEVTVRLSEANEQIATLTAARQNLVSDLEAINKDADLQAEILKSATLDTQQSSSILASRIEQQSELLTEILHDLTEMTDRETVTAQANLDLIATTANLEAQLALSRRTERDFAAECQILGNRVVELERSLAINKDARTIVEESLATLTEHKDVAEQRHTTALAEFREAILEENIAEVESIRKEMDAERQALANQLVKLEQALALDKAAKEVAEKNFVELVQLKDVADRQNAAALAELREAMQREAAVQIESARGESSATQRALSDRLIEVEQSLASNEAAKMAAEKSLIEIAQLKDAADHQTTAALTELKDAVIREQVARAEISRRAEHEARMGEVYRQTAIDLAAAQNVIDHQAHEISKLVSAGHRMSANFETIQKVLNQQAIQFAGAQAAVLAHQVDLRSATETVATLNGAILEMTSSEVLHREEREAWEAEQSRWEAERNAWTAERQAWRAEARAWSAEREGIQAELEARSVERTAQEVEMHAWRSQSQGWTSERDAHHAERQTWDQERQAWNGERNRLTLALAEANQRADAAWWARLRNHRRQ